MNSPMRPERISSIEKRLPMPNEPSPLRNISAVRTRKIPQTSNRIPPTKNALTCAVQGEFQIVESLQMCAADRAVELDIEEAYACGKKAAELAEQGVSGVMVTLERASAPGEPYRCELGTVPLKQVANVERPLPDDYIRSDGMFITPEFLEYVRPLVGELPEYATLRM